MENPTLLSDLKHHVLTLTLNRPQRGNSLDPPTLVELHQKILDAQSNENIRLIVLTATGEKDFCTGIDIDSVKNLPVTQKTNIANVAGDIANLLYLGKPSIVVINGRAMGMGVVFATAADYRICVDTAKFQMPEANVGIFPGASCIALMTRVCGVAATRKMLLFAESFGSNDALNTHIVDEILSRSAIPERLLVLTKSLIQKSPLLMRCIKFSINNSPDLSYLDTVKLENEFAAYYSWKDPKTQFSEITNRFSQSIFLTGDPNALLMEFRNTKKK